NRAHYRLLQHPPPPPFPYTTLFRSTYADSKSFLSSGSDKNPTSLAPKRSSPILKRRTIDEDRNGESKSGRNRRAPRLAVFLFQYPAAIPSLRDSLAPT